MCVCWRAISGVAAGGPCVFQSIDVAGPHQVLLTSHVVVVVAMAAVRVVLIAFTIIVIIMIMVVIMIMLGHNLLDWKKMQRVK